MSHASSPVWATVVAAALLVLLAGCSGTTPARTQSVARAAEVPETGACRDLAASAISRSADATATVDCSKDHTAETFAVGEFPKAVAAAGYDDRALGRYMYRTCGAAYLRFLGGDDSAALRSLFSWAWFRPAEAAWKDGKRWYRCDLVGGPVGATTLRDLPRSARGYLAGNPTTSPHQEWTLCAKGETFSGSTKVPCSTEHDWRAVTTIKLGDPRDAYPGDRVAAYRTNDFCTDSVRAYLGYPAEDFDYATTVFGKAEWQSGNRRSVCWARTVK